ncbi:MAG: hypothetical protein U5K56_11985 [Halioglobus sp.]|nr:hypothetical protein [Halioglobus sp.]
MIAAGQGAARVPHALKRLRATHRVNAMALAAFILVHLLTHLSGYYGIETYNAVQSALRTVYRYPPIEALLLISITAQLLMGAALLVMRLRRGRPHGFWAWLQVVSGGVFFVFMAQHLYSLAMARLYFDLDTNFYWPASVMSGPWFIYYFAAYYVLGVFALFAHIGAGVRFALYERRPVAAQRVGVAFLIVGAAIALAIPPIIAGAFYEITLPREWIDYLRFYAPGFEPW